MIKVLLFGSIAQKAGVRQTEITAADNGLAVSDLMKVIQQKIKTLPAGPYIYAVNNEQATLSTLVKNGDEVAIMPPFAGG